MRFRYFQPRTPTHGHRHIFTLDGFFDVPDVALAMSVTITEASSWCTQHIGGRSGSLDENPWHASRRQIYIRDDADAVAFRLRWC